MNEKLSTSNSSCSKLFSSTIMPTSLSNNTSEVSNITSIPTTGSSLKSIGNISPIVSKPFTINNYTHLITLLKIKQMKYKKYSISPSNFPVFLSAKREIFSTETIFDGFLQNSLKNKFYVLKNSILKSHDKIISERIKNIKKENELTMRASSICPNTELSLFLAPSSISFGDQLLFDMYSYLQEHMAPLEYLQKSYLIFIESFLKKFDKMNIKQKITEFCRLKFNKNEFNMSVFEGRCLWAEIYVLYRIGYYTEIEELLEEFESYFEFMNEGFKSRFKAFIDRNEFSNIQLKTNDDKFKIFLVNLMNQTMVSDGFVIQTVEDYIFTVLKLNNGSCDRLKIEDFERSNVRLMVSLFKNEKKTSISLLLKSDFSLVSKFYLLRELCFSNDSMEVEDSTVSLVSEANDDALQYNVSTQLNYRTIFLKFVFNITSNLSSSENKIKLLSLLKDIPDYHNVIPVYLVKYGLFDLIKCRDNPLDQKIVTGVISLLQKTNKKGLLQVSELVDEHVLSSVIEEVIEQSILTDSPIKEEVFTHISIVNSSLKDLKGFYYFNFDPCIKTLNRTCLFDIDYDLTNFKLIIEHLFPKVVSVLKYSFEKDKARKLFEICGTLGLNEECTQMIAQDLVMLI